MENINEDSEIGIEEINRVIIKKKIEENKSEKLLFQNPESPLNTNKSKKIKISKETHKFLTSKFVVDVNKSDSYSFIIDESMPGLHKIMKYLKFDIAILKKNQNRDETIENVKDGNWIILTKDFKIYQKYQGINRVFFNFRHTMTPDDQFNGLMRQLKLPFKTSEDILQIIEEES